VKGSKAISMILCIVALLKNLKRMMCCLMLLVVSLRVVAAVAACPGGIRTSSVLLADTNPLLNDVTQLTLKVVISSAGIVEDWATTPSNASPAKIASSGVIRTQTAVTWSVLMKIVRTEGHRRKWPPRRTCSSTTSL
jgi:hypothetical protein